MLVLSRLFFFLLCSLSALFFSFSSWEWVSEIWGGGGVSLEEAMKLGVLGWILVWLIFGVMG